MRSHNLTDLPDPTAADLAAIETEEPLISAELAWLAAEISILDSDERGGPSDLDRRRLRRAEARVIRETFAYIAARRACGTELDRAA
ncbi:DUF6284 family protein [Actinoplanes sp. NPDC049118]|uniref:DUF6284 family protein n=1 Tax=Actinoplanes sp. NPDC049118 TaxID=3155769 RepID=UPI00340ACE1F